MYTKICIVHDICTCGPCRVTKQWAIAKDTRRCCFLFSCHGTRNGKDVSGFWIFRHFARLYVILLVVSEFFAIWLVFTSFCDLFSARDWVYWIYWSLQSYVLSYSVVCMNKMLQAPSDKSMQPNLDVRLAYHPGVNSSPHRLPAFLGQ